MVQRSIEEIDQRRLLQRMITDALRKHRCRTIKEVVYVLQGQDTSLTLEEIRGVVEELKNENKITLSEPVLQGSFLDFAVSLRSLWFWLTMSLTFATLALIFLLPQAGAWMVLRMLAGGIFVLFVPGYSLVKLLFTSKDLDPTENIALSLALSLGLVPLIGFMLNYAPTGITLEPVVASLSAISIGMSFGGLYKKFRATRKLHASSQ